MRDANYLLFIQIGLYQDYLTPGLSYSLPRMLRGSCEDAAWLFPTQQLHSN